MFCSCPRCEFLAFCALSLVEMGAIEEAHEIARSITRIDPQGNHVAEDGSADSSEGYADRWYRAPLAETAFN